MDISSHPCFSAKCRPQAGRLHLPVAPGCNIFCRFCSRGFSKDAEKPGNAAKVISPEEALGIMDMALSLCPEIKVAGVAGPGDPLAGPEALDALFLIKKEHPGLICCLSTNGLMLEESMERLLLAGVQTLTVTVNALDPEILLKINRGILTEDGFMGGLKAQEALIGAQERGIKLARKNSMFIKINSVLMPGINDAHIPFIAKRAKEWGAELINVIPLIPSGELENLKAPSKEEWQRAASAAEKHLPVKTNCRRCRADACGIPGVSDFREEIYGTMSFPETFSHG
jgi:nitrogen fixation protein NifB